MKQGKLAVLLTLILGISLVAFTPATGQTKKGGKGGAAALGAKVFDENCTACHDGGNNTVEAEKTLHLDALKKNGFNGPPDIVKRVEEGKGIMPVFKDQLKPEEIEAVANYVWGKAQKDWK